MCQAALACPWSLGGGAVVAAGTLLPFRQGAVAFPASQRLVASSSFQPLHSTRWPQARQQPISKVAHLQRRSWSNWAHFKQGPHFHGALVFHLRHGTLAPPRCRGSFWSPAQVGGQESWVTPAVRQARGPPSCHLPVAVQACTSGGVGEDPWPLFLLGWGQEGRATTLC